MILEAMVQAQLKLTFTGIVEGLLHKSCLYLKIIFNCETKGSIKSVTVEKFYPPTVPDILLAIYK